MKNYFKDYHGMTDPSCLLKFAWSTIRLYEKSTNSCHRVKSDKLTIENFDDFHNTPLKLSARQDMMDGKWPGGGCEYCQKIEEVNGISDRMIENTGRADMKRYIPIELQKNNRAVKVTPTIVEVYFNNLCNMSCIYCSADYSTTWENENRKFNLVSNDEITEYDKRKEEYPAILSRYWKWLEKNAPFIIEYNVLGGEPFFQSELEQNIEFFENNPCPNLIFTIFSNFKVANSKFRKILDKIENLVNNKCIKEFKIFASIDAWGPQEEYVRYGLNLIQWEENYKTLVTDYPNIKLIIHSTMCNLNIKTVTGLIEKVNEGNEFRVKNSLPLIRFSCSLADGQTYLRSDIFPSGFFDNDFEKMIAITNDERTKLILKGFKDTINNQPYCPDLVEGLKLHLDDIDKRRKLNWRSLFPWLDEFKIELYAQ